MGACMRDRLGIRGKLTIIKTDRASGKIIEKRKTRNAITYNGALWILRYLYDPQTYIDNNTKLNKLYLLDNDKFLVKVMINPTYSENGNGNVRYVDLLWNDTSTDNYVVSYVCIVPLTWGMSITIDPNNFTHHCAKLSPSLEKTSSDTVTYKWTIKLSYGIV